MGNGLKYLLFLLLMAVLWLPWAQRQCSLVEEWPLHGHSDPAPVPTFSMDGLMSGELTERFERQLKERTGFRGHLVRLRNQVYYALFHVAKANAVVIGKENVLLDVEYINAYYGTDFAGTYFLREQMTMWKAVQDTLLAHGTHAVIVFAPGKASFFPEHFPDRLKRDFAPRTNYAYLRQLCDSMGVTYIDLKAYFHAMTDTARHPLFTRGGIHWSEYGAMMAQVKLGKELGGLLGCALDSIPLRIERDIIPRGTDNDIERGMNLLFDLKRDTMAYCVPLYMGQGHAPTVLAIGDSYYWNLFSNGFRDRLCRHGGFWYYFREAHPDFVFDHKGVKDLDLRTEVLKNEVLLLVMTEPQLPRFGWGSVETLHEVFCYKKY